MIFQGDQSRVGLEARLAALERRIDGSVQQVARLYSALGVTPAGARGGGHPGGRGGSIDAAWHLADEAKKTAEAIADEIAKRSDVWDRAEIISEDHRLLTEYLSGDITLEQLEASLQAKVGLIDNTRLILGYNPDHPEQFMSVRMNAEEITSTVAKLDDLGHPEQFSSISQLADGITLLVARFDEDMGLAFARIDMNADSIVSLVSRQDIVDGELVTAFSRIDQNADEIDLRVIRNNLSDAATMVSSINLTPDHVRLSSGKIILNGDTTVLGGFRVESGNVAIVDTSNMVSNPVFMDYEGAVSTSGWGGLSGTAALGSAANLPARFAGRLNSAAASVDAYFISASPGFPVVAAEVYYVGCWVSRRGNANAQFGLGLRFRDNSNGGSDWKVGVYAPGGLPNNGWLWVEGYVTVPPGKTLGVVWATVRAVAGPVGYWLFTGVVVRRAADTKLLVDGRIELTNADRQAGALVVKDSAGVERAVFGNVTGKKGVPPGTQFGMWADLGGGSWIVGVPRLLHAGSLSQNSLQLLASGSYPVGAVASGVASWPIGPGASSFTVPAGKKWVVAAQVDSIVQSVGSTAPLAVREILSLIRVSGVQTINKVISAGSYSSLHLDASPRFIAVQAFTGLVRVDVVVSYTIMEVDA